MARTNQAKADALARVRARHRAATSKASRLRSNGVEVTGTGIDPRRDLSRVKNYTVRQLEAYERELNAFTDRRTSYVAGSEGRPLPRNAWSRYKRLERQVNELHAGRMARIADVHIPMAGMTVGERQETLRSKFPTMHGPAANNPYAVVNRVPEQIRSPEALARFTRQMEQRLDDGYQLKNNRAARKNIRDMLNASGLKEIQPRIDRLSSSQLRVLWNFTKFAEDLSTNYELITAGAVQAQGRYAKQQMANALEDVNDYLDWAETLPKNVGEQEGTQGVRGGLRNNRRQGRKR